MTDIAKGDIIQITNASHPWFPALQIVDEQKSFGCQAYLHHIGDGNRVSGQAYQRLNDKDYERVGRSVIDVE